MRDRRTWMAEAGAGTGGQEPGGQETGGGLLNGGGTGGDGDGGATGSWLEGLDEDTRGWVGTKGYKTPGDMVQAYRSLEQTMGKDKVVVPGENATEEERAAFFKAGGRPEDAAGYGLGDFKPANEQVTVAGEWMGEFAEAMFEAGASKQIVDAATNLYFNEFLPATLEAKEIEQKDIEAENEALTRQILGQEFKAASGSVYELLQRFGEMPTVKKALEAQGFKDDPELGPAIKQAVDESALANSPVMFLALHALRADLGDDLTRVGSGAPGGGEMTVQQAEQEIEKLVKSEEFQQAMFGNDGKAKARMIARRSQLFDIAARDKPPDYHETV